MTRRLTLQQWMVLAVALLVVAVIVGAGSASLNRRGFFGNGADPGDSAGGALLGTAAATPLAGAPRGADEDATTGAVAITTAADASGGSDATTTTAPASSGSKATTTTAPATTTTTAPGTTTTTAPATTTTTTTTTTAPPPPPPPPPPPAIKYYAGDTGDFCARLSGVRTGAGLPALASCGQTSALQGVALQFAQAKSVWHTGVGNEIVGYTFREMSGLVANFAGSPAHYAIITAGTTGVTAKVGCYYREDPVDGGARYIFCIAQFA